MRFLNAKRLELIALCRAKVALGPERAAKSPIGIQTLERSAQPMRGRDIAGPAGGAPAASEIGMVAAAAGGELLRFGFTVDQVEHDYGDPCQAISDPIHPS